VSVTSRLRTLLPALALGIALGACAPAPVTPAPTTIATSTRGPSASPVPGASLSGTLLFAPFSEPTAGAPGAPQLARLDLATGAVTKLFAPPPRGWLATAAVSPDGLEIAIAYAPPAPAGASFGQIGLYLVSPDGLSPPVPLNDNQSANDSYFFPAWSPDGHYLYYSHVVTDPSDQSVYTTTLERVAYPVGSPEVLVKDAIWPRVSPDGARLAYVTLDPVTLDSSLVVSDVQGKNPTVLVPAKAFPALDAVVFSPDGRTILFSASGDRPAKPPAWLDWLMGVQGAAAHNVPSDLWRVPASGGPPERLTSLYDTGMLAALTPDGGRMIFTSSRGLYAMDLSGGDPQLILGTPVSGVLDWLVPPNR
jgi:Tol biopolymer transport system component